MLRRDGFTLVELMIVVSIMGTMAALIAPGLGELAADNRASSASEDLVRLSRHMRARAQETGLAHMLIFSGDEHDSGGLGRFRVYEGMNNHCRQTPWKYAVDTHAPVESVDLGNTSYNYPTGSSAATKSDSGRQVISITAAGSGATDTAAVLCYEPSGATFVAALDNGSAIGYSFTTQTTPVVFTVTRAVSSEVRGLLREVVFPPGGTARFRI